MRPFLRLLPPSPFPQPRPALGTPRSPAVSAALRRRTAGGLGGGSVVPGSSACGLRAPGVTGRAGGSALGKGTEPPSPLVNFPLRGCGRHRGRCAQEVRSRPGGGGSGERTCQQPVAQVFLSWDELLLRPTPARARSSPLSYLASRLAQPWKTGNRCAERKRDLFSPWPLGSGGLGGKTCNSRGIFQLITSPLRGHQSFSPLCCRLEEGRGREGLASSLLACRCLS